MVIARFGLEKAIEAMFFNQCEGGFCIVEGLLKVVVSRGEEAVTGGFVVKDEGLKMIAFFLCMAGDSFCQDMVMVFCVCMSMWVAEKIMKNGFLILFLSPLPFFSVR